MATVPAPAFGALLAHLLVAGPTAAQSKPFPPEIRDVSAAEAEAEAVVMKEEGVGAGEVARALRRRHRQSDARIAGTLIALEYASRDVRVGLLDGLGLSSERAASTLAGALAEATPHDTTGVARGLHEAGFRRSEVDLALRSAFRMSASAVAAFLTTLFPETP